MTGGHGLKGIGHAVETEEGEAMRWPAFVAMLVIAALTFCQWTPEQIAAREFDAKSYCLGRLKEQSRIIDQEFQGKAESLEADLKELDLGDDGARMLRQVLRDQARIDKANAYQECMVGFGYKFKK